MSAVPQPPVAQRSESEVEIKAAVRTPLLTMDNIENGLEVCPWPLMIIDKSSRIVAVNSEAERLLPGITAAKGQNLWLQFPSLGGHTVESACHLALRQDGHARVEYFDESTQRWLELSVRDLGGEISLAIRDITDRLSMLLASYQLAAIVEGSGDAIIGKRLDGTITSWNKGAERMFGYTAEEMIGRSIHKLAPSGREKEMDHFLSLIRTGERIASFETVRRTKSGQEIPVSLTISPVYGPDGSVVGASKIARDISPQKAAEEALRRSNASLRQANEDLEHFAYSASHDLKEPIRNIAISSELLARRYLENLEPEANVFLDRIRAGASRLSSLVDGLLQLTQAANFDLDETKTEVDTRAALSAALIDLSESIAENDVTVEVSELPRITILEIHLRQLFQNLIGNAIKYRGPAAPRIEVLASRQDPGWIFSVRDNGVGIASEYQERIFGAFKRLNANHVAGAGIGLALCKRIVERYGGQIWVESEPARGSTFFFSIPDR